VNTDAPRINFRKYLILNDIFIRLRKLLTLLLMLILPLQGLAAAYAPLHQALNPSANAMPCHEHQGVAAATHDAANAEHAPTPDAPRDTDVTNHLCCHQVFTCAPSSALTPAAHKFSDVSRFVLPLATLYIPDSPDRPPRG
jgi:hypothetical protein